MASKPASAAPSARGRPSVAASKASALVSAVGGNYWRTKKLPVTAFSFEESRPEFRQLDYTPVTTARPKDLDKPLRVRRLQRPISLCICITAYDEGPKRLQRTLQAIGKNMPALAVQGGIDWEELLVCIIIDGRTQADELLLEYLKDEVKVYDPSMLVRVDHGQEVVMHIFEKSVELPKHSAQREYYSPMQIMFCMKERNGGKLHSHLWFFSAFCEQIQPKYTLLLDVGTAPREDAINKLLASMERNGQIGGVCGELAVEKPNYCNGFQAAQHFEYKVNTITDKPMESIFGFINVLPGAFSAYRWVAIRGEPLTQYFLVEETPVEELDPFTANMYLAEDRVLCFAMVAKTDRNWTCHFNSSAVATTDIPKNLISLIMQRRRWLNGAFFSLLHYVGNFHRFATKASHSIPRLSWMCVEFMYQLMQLLMNWTSAGSMFLVMVIIFGLTMEDWVLGKELLYVFTVIYTFLTVLQIIVGLGSEPKDMKLVYWMCTWAYALMMMVTMGCGVYLIIMQRISLFVATTGLVSFAGYFVVGALHGELVPMVLSFFQYLFLLPMFVNMFQIFSLCNINDVSWGTREGKLNYVHGRHVAEVAPQQVHKQAVTQEDAALEAKVVASGEGTKKVAAMARMVGRNAAAAKDAVKIDVGDIVIDAHAGKSLGVKQDKQLRAQSVALLMDAATRMALSDEGPKFDETEALINSVLDKEAQRVKEAGKAQELQLAALKRRYAAFRTRVLGLWMISNFLYISVILFFSLEFYFAWGFTIFVAFLVVLRILGSIIYLIKRVTTTCSRAMRGCCLTSCPCCFRRYPNQRDAYGEYEVPPRCCCCAFGEPRRPSSPDYIDNDEPESEEETKEGGDAAAAAAAAMAVMSSKADQTRVANAVNGVIASAAKKEEKRKKRHSKRPSKRHSSSRRNQGQPMEYKAAYGAGMPGRHGIMPPGGGMPPPGMMPPPGGMPPPGMMPQGMMPGMMQPPHGMGGGPGMMMPGPGGMAPPGYMPGMPMGGMPMPMQGMPPGSMGYASGYGSRYTSDMTDAQPQPQRQQRQQTQSDYSDADTVEDDDDDASGSGEGEGEGEGVNEMPGIKRADSFTLAEEAFAGDRVQAKQGSTRTLQRNHSAPQVRGDDADDLSATRNTTVETAEDGSTVRVVKRERMIDLVGALDEGEQLSELLAPRAHKTAGERWKLLEQVGRFVGLGHKKTRKQAMQDRIAAIKERAGKF